MEFLSRLFHALFVLHPLHTMLVHFPIALTTTALFFILLATWKKNAILEQVAFANLCVASVSVIVAGISGLRDNLLFYNGSAPNILWKITLAIILLILSAITCIWRWRRPGVFTTKSTRWVYVIAYLVCFALAAVIGFLGGVIVYGF